MAAMSSEDMENKHLLDAYYEEIVKYVIPSHITPYLAMFVENHILQEILMKENANRSLAIAQLVQELRKCSRPGWFKQLKVALEKERYEKICKMLNNEDVKNEEVHEEYLCKNFRQLCEKIQFSKLTDILIEKNTISRQEVDELLAIQNNRGIQQSAQNLLLRISHRSENYFADLNYALKEGGYDELVHPDLQAANTHESMQILASGLRKNLTTGCASKKQKTVYDEEEQMSQRLEYHVEAEINQDVEAGQAHSHSSHSSSHLSTDDSASTKTESHQQGVPKTPPTATIAPMRKQPGNDRETELLKTKSDETEVLKLQKENTQVLKSKPSECDFTAPVLNLSEVDSEIDESSLNLDLRPDWFVEEVSKKVQATALRDGAKNKTRSVSEAGSDSDATRLIRSSGNDLSQSVLECSSIENPGRTKTECSSDSRETSQDYTTTLTTDGSAARPKIPRMEIKKETLELRSYQKELAEEAIKENNCLIVAPTGSGKTHVALYISQNHLDKSDMMKENKIAFIVPTVALVAQQCSQYQKYMTSDIKIDGLSGEETESAKMSLDKVISRNDVMVMTPQILLNALEEEHIDSLGAFSLIIFDECHHTMKDHPYNLIMSKYVDELLSNSEAELPQIVGLTASPGVGKAVNKRKAEEHILQLCANMAAKSICYVKKNIAELEKFTNKPDEGTTEVKGRQFDPFYEKIGSIMQTIEQHMMKQDLTAVLQEVPTMDKMLQPPATRGSDPYTQYVSRVKRANAPIREHDIRRIFVACLRHLEIYNNSLFINADCRTTDALAYLAKELSEFHNRDTTDFWLLNLFTECETHLKKISVSPEAKNPKLDSLKDAILESYNKIPESQGIVFCKTREMTFALVNWMKEDRDLLSLNPTNLIGTQKSGGGGFSRSKLEDGLKNFKDGIHKLIVATSVAEEGLDVQKCNYVIRYEHVTNDIARVQAKGRARADEATSRLITDSSRGIAQRDEANKIREGMMIEVVEIIKRMSAEEFSHKIEELQWKSKVEREMVTQSKTHRDGLKKNREHKDEYELRCIKCDAFGAWSQDLRTIKETHHVLVGDEEFKDRITLIPHPRPKKFDNWEKKAKILCKSCGEDWGINALHSGVPYSVLAICNFVIVDPNEERSCVKKWKDVVFPVLPLSLDDMKNMNKNL